MGSDKSLKPLIGITSTTLSINPPYNGAYVADGYHTGMARAGATPIIIPLVEEEDVWQDILERIDGLIFTGGHDIHPLYYGEGLHPKIGELDPLRDRMEIRAAQYALRLDKPILGICRGCQLLNVAQGGTLYQDINAQRENSYLHQQTAPRPEPTHYVNLAKGSRMADIFQMERILTNSFHHQAIKDLAPGFKSVAQAEDGVIEGFESLNHSFVLGIQFHPEMMWHQSEQMFNVATYFLDVVRGKER